MSSHTCGFHGKYASIEDNIAACKTTRIICKSQTAALRLFLRHRAHDLFATNFLNFIMAIST